MIAHPSLEQLEQLVTDESNGSEQEALAAHLDGCNHCQDLLTRRLERNDPAAVPRLRLAIWRAARFTAHSRRA